jgi:hypothetical protein
MELCHLTTGLSRPWVDDTGSKLVDRRLCRIGVNGPRYTRKGPVAVQNHGPFRVYFNRLNTISMKIFCPQDISCD